MPCVYERGSVARSLRRDKPWLTPLSAPDTGAFQAMQRLSASLASDVAEAVAACAPVDPLAHLSRPPNASDSRITGPDRMVIIQRTLDSFGTARSKNQREFHREMLKAALQLIYKDDLDEHLDELLRYFDCAKFKSEVMIVTPRRWGKTWSVAMFVVACAAGIEGVEQAIFSTGRRASKKLLDLIYRLIRKIPGLRDSIITRNVETIWIQGPGGADDIRKIYSYPSKASHARARVRVSLLLKSQSSANDLPSASENGKR